MLSGINFPHNGKPIYQEDFTHDRELLTEEIVSRLDDFFKGRIIEGGAVTIGSIPNSVHIEATKGYDPMGRRFQFSNVFNLNVSIANAESFIVVRHKFMTESSNQLDSYGYANTFRNNSHDILFVSNPNPNDVTLAHISSILGEVTILDDHRIFKRLEGENIKENSISDSKLSDTIKVGNLNDLIASFNGNKSSLVSALNHIANLLSLETQTRNLALDNKDYIRSVGPATKIRFQISGNFIYWSRDNGATWLPFA